MQKIDAENQAAMSKDWQTLVAHALLGTAQHQPSPATVELELLRQLDSTEPEHWLLLASAVMATYARAGFVPRVLDAEEITVAPAETLAECSPQVAAHLRFLLGQFSYPQTFLRELLAHLAQQQRRVPFDLILVLLNMARANRALAAVILPVIGERGRWLAAQHPEWVKLLKSTPPVEASEPLDDAALLAALQAHPHPFLLSAPVALKDSRWGKPVADAFVQRLLSEAQVGRTFYGDQTLVELASLIPQQWLTYVLGRVQQRPNWLTSVMDRIQQRAPEPNPAIQALVEMLELRRQILQDLAAQDT